MPLNILFLTSWRSSEIAFHISKNNCVSRAIKLPIHIFREDGSLAFSPLFLPDIPLLTSPPPASWIVSITAGSTPCSSGTLFLPQSLPAAGSGSLLFSLCVLTELNALQVFLPKREKTPLLHGRITLYSGTPFDFSALLQAWSLHLIYSSSLPKALNTPRLDRNKLSSFRLHPPGCPGALWTAVPRLPAFP